MRHAFGRDIPETMEDLLGQRAAVLVWDMQQAIAGRVHDREGVVAGVRRVVDAAHAADVPVMYTRHYSLPFEAEDAAWIRMWWRRSGAESPETLSPLALPGTAAWEFLPEVVPGPSDIVLPKTRPNLFLGTPAREILAAHGVQTLVLTGVTTDRGILTTTNHAVFVGLLPVVVSDATGAYTQTAHERALTAAAEVGDVTTSHVVEVCWRR